MGYDYDCLCRDVKKLCENYGMIEKEVIGKSVMGRDIISLKAGTGEKKIVLLGAYHGLEYLTAAFLMKFLSDYTLSAVLGNEYFGRNASELFKNVTLYIIPMVNPDGVDIAVNGLDITNAYHRELISLVGIHSFNNVWQANARGVDLNHNHNADWSMVIERPSFSKFGGEYPESEPEIKAVVDFVRRIDCDMLLSFHSQGKEIYYDFKGMAPEGAKETAQKMARQSGYSVSQPEGSAAFGGCKDWFISEFGRMGFTVEIGIGKNPLPMEQLNDVYEENANIVLCVMEE
jgi:g-D-glutamyl-meso-diaminopimelate peptidase